MSETKPRLSVREAAEAVEAAWTGYHGMGAPMSGLYIAIEALRVALSAESEREPSELCPDCGRDGAAHGGHAHDELQRQTREKAVAELVEALTLCVAALRHPNSTARSPMGATRIERALYKAESILSRLREVTS